MWCLQREPPTKVENGIRLASYLHPTSLRVQVASELGEAAIHSGAKLRGDHYADLLLYAKSKDAAMDVIFDQAVNPHP